MRERRDTLVPVERLLHPLQEFLHQEASGGLLLLGCAAIAVLWANSPWPGGYHALWQVKLTFGLGGYSLAKPLQLWINDGLMAIFFFVVGLELKREVLVGELASVRQAMLPVMAAVGGMVAPALLYFALNGGGPGDHGWGIPMATDIAFALGILALLKAPAPLRIFLTALAIVDDLGAVLVIALFYTAGLAWTSLLLGLGLLALAVLANRAGVRHPLVYAVLGVGVWVAFLKSGVHATIAGVLMALTIPSRPRLTIEQLAERGRAALEEVTARTTVSCHPDERCQAALQALERGVQEVESPLQRLEHSLHPWVAFLIVPVFALANAGVTLGGDLVSSLTDEVSLGIVLGLAAGKQIGVTLGAWIAVKLGMADLPGGVDWRQIHGVGCLAGIGFTMSLFIAGLAFGSTPLLEVAKLGILLASLISGFLGWILLRSRTAPATPGGMA
jgi:NhaA family Na+:H+ antiporter